MTDPRASPAGANALLRKLSRYATFDDPAQDAIDGLERTSEWVSRRAVLISEGETEAAVVVLWEGLAYRHKDFRDGRRQIIGLLVPGDICGGHGESSSPVDYGVRTLTRARVARINADRFLQTQADHPSIARALQRAMLVEQAIQRAWIVNLGQRKAHERIAHLLCELAQRLSDCGFSRPDGGFEVALTQDQLGSALGLTSVHVNRVLQRLRAEGFLDFDRGVVRIHEVIRLQSLADFNPAYLSNSAPAIS